MRTVASFFKGLELLGLSLWVGGMLTLGILVAPTIFNTVTPAELAGETMSQIFRKFNGGLVYACIFLIVVGFLGKFFITGRPNRARWIEGGIILIMTVVGVYIGAILGPRMQELRQIRIADPSNISAAAEFDQGHHRSRNLFTLNLLLGIGLLFLNSREAIDSREKQNGA